MSPDVLLECPRTSFRDVLRVNVTERVWHSPPPLPKQHGKGLDTSVNNVFNVNAVPDNNRKETRRNHCIVSPGLRSRPLQFISQLQSWTCSQQSAECKHRLLQPRWTIKAHSLIYFNIPSNMNVPIWTINLMMAPPYKIYALGVCELLFGATS